MQTTTEEAWARYLAARDRIAQIVSTQEARLRVLRAPSGLQTAYDWVVWEAFYGSVSSLEMTLEELERMLASPDQGGN